jgi:hypothetical protein
VFEFQRIIGKDSGLSLTERLILVCRFNFVSRKVECQHLESEILSFACEVSNCLPQLEVAWSKQVVSRVEAPRN